ncbi:electron transfer flavoprotein subunit alpha/FixB family protein [Desulfonema magnum]|uniref:Electron transfer flavoprotein subunit alpha family protein n=1 Tax=Desulfonema magnum TaxID=45655 RepID=A0A975GMJ8_9BACT|nr:electron transfer flavoprotein subunit alpha/FixB family protein [Desulfonema magnum]QTA86877.1 Electron transfer flavoprotein subunit alpha family protein [Desulfonema magnum]
MSENLLVIAEHDNNKFSTATYQLLSTGHMLSEQIKCSLSVAVLGSITPKALNELAEYGADKIILVEDEKLNQYVSDVYTHTLSAIITQENPLLVLLNSSFAGKELSATLAARVRAAVATECMAVRKTDKGFEISKFMYGSKISAKIELYGKPVIAAMQTSSLSIVKSKRAGRIVKLNISVPETKFRIVRQENNTEKIPLSQARAVVSGGRGVGGSDFSVLEQLAETLNGAVGASRSAIDAGWRPVSDQIGQTGITVSPDLYIACGISGSSQHIAGIAGSKTVVAINKDSHAPIFSKADYGIKGDLFEIIPCLTEVLKARKHSGGNAGREMEKHKTKQISQYQQLKTD